MFDVKQGNDRSALDAFMTAMLQASLNGKKKGRKLKPPRIWIRKDRLTDGEPTIYAVFRGKIESMGLPASREEEANALLSTTILAIEARARGLVAPRDVSVKVILEWYRDRMRCLPGASRHQKKARKEKVTRTRTLLRRLGDKTIGDLDGDAILDYVEQRMTDTHGSYSKRKDPPQISLTTACDDISHLRQAIRAYVGFFQIPWMPVIDIPPHFTRRDFLVDRHHFARILESCRGYIWDSANGTWLTEEIRDPETGETRRVRIRRDPKTVLYRRAVARLVRIALYSGTRHGAAIGIRWRMNANGGCVDVKNKIIHRAGYGVSPDEGKPQATSAMRPQLAILTWIWERRDAATGATHVIHKPNGQPYRCKLSGTVREVMADAGQPEVCVHSLRHAAISHMMFDGYDVGVVSDIIGVSPKTVWQVYRQWGMQAQMHAVGAGRRPTVKDWVAVRSDPEADFDNGAANQPLDRSFRRKVAVVQRPTDGRSVRRPVGVIAKAA